MIALRLRKEAPVLDIGHMIDEIFFNFKKLNHPVFFDVGHQ